MAELALTASTTDFVSLAEVKRHANVPATNVTHDAELDLFREAAEEAVRGLVGHVTWRTFTETGRAHGGVLALRHLPVLSVDSILAAGSTLTGYGVDLEAGLVTGLRTWSATDVVVTYTAGRATVPASIRVATLIIAEHLWTTQRGNAPAAAVLQGEEVAVIPGMAYGIPNRATDLLRPYLLPPAIG